MINKGKNFCYMHSKTALAIAQEVKCTTGFLRGQFPLIYLGCPIGHAKMKKVHFAELIQKIQNKQHICKEYPHLPLLYY
ncbi:hypothetical protein H5410_027894 [Solanum commersonii]|uniref:Uncharacterized protein n=1 Tax=Solanum commersonii TaxID=4109 RepID=A0A9J5Z146_SOLCO|nr:hypothetical protein H5410_027894 [Solanum commersonii]